MGLQLTTLLHRAVRGREVVAAGPPRADGPPVGVADLRDVTAARVRALVADADRVRFDALVAGSDDAVVLRRALAATASVDAVAELAGALARSTPGDRRAVRDPVPSMARQGRQSDGTTCGSSVLAMLAAHGDPTLALWLATGTVLASARPPELSGAPDAALDRLAEAPREARFAAVQRVLRRRTSARAVLGLAWPPRYGTPPWTAARTARFLGVTYDHRPLDDTDAAHLAGALAEVGTALDAGVPVPLYSGGDTARGWDTALPRHVVLAFARDDAGWHVWEPGAGAVVVADRRALTSGRPHAALGHWDHLAWVLAPRLR
ncbi:hypothetical protein [Actinotalea sp. JY-7876]|uniref:hypothetical protein n=1 Tax=Actinotalea sp. JY-7876 TaxID=2758442 RepID=UPI0015F56CFE|nr:hypothetical protein [Actinotalea sp. JY-7876]